ncbi:hypothetical protein Desor_2194 [Desulfosporosinus orientis DSM 765]|uniref:Uncharacterized protein n=1 Tax=Desulfosporosinus orientis (strain ATCC 19365 / DSM 765 / NCIMB 8382 / VKM B-1628 / Singapore I) TaxID=768706 RepID=G7W8T6_DESOD|nr:hypothetical protein [Desulfosporosinus orientis]AET67796.1 hypothetical protein Desor_2194 [Desulfosporosinus orientis DSM 765]
MNTIVRSITRPIKKAPGGRISFLFLLLIFLTLTVGCSAQSVQVQPKEKPDRFTLAEQEGQFIAVNRSVDCKGTQVSIEKILLDKTHTFMIAAVAGETKGSMDSLTVDLFGDQDQDLGRCNMTQKLPDGKTLLTFDAIEKAPSALRLEFFGGPVGYGGNVNLTLKDIPFHLVDSKTLSEYIAPATLEKKGYRLDIKSIENGVSETGLQYQLTVSGDYDGIESGWLFGSYHQSYPQILFLSAGGQNIEPHLSYPFDSTLSYRRSLDGKACVGHAYFDRVTAGMPQLKLTDIYGYYNLNEIIPLDGVTDQLEINRKVSVHNDTIELKTLKPGKDKGTWILSYRIQDQTGKLVDGAIDAGFYQKGDHYKRPNPVLKDSSPSPVGQDQELVLNAGVPAPGEADFPAGTALKITRLGIRQEDAVLNIDPDNLPQPAANSTETQILAAVRDYYATYGQALKSNDLSMMTKKYGDLQPTGRNGDGINDWRRKLQVWSPLGVKDYFVTFQDPIVMVNGSTATADIGGQEKIVRADGDSGSVFALVFSLVQEDGIWKITKVDELTDGETGA